MLDNCGSLKCLTTAGCKNLVSYVRRKPEQLCDAGFLHSLFVSPFLHFHLFTSFTFLPLYFFNYKVMMPFTRS